MNRQNSHRPENKGFVDYLQQLKLEELAGVLENQQEPVWECELMKVAFPEADLINGAPLEIYRWHFVLFHVLYKLASEFAGRGLYLHIHFMRTCVKKNPGPTLCRYFDDKLTNFCGALCREDRQLCDFHFQKIDDAAIDSLSERYFYLNPANFEALSCENAEKFIGGAWNLLQNPKEYHRCLRVMGLPEGVSIDLLKKRFRYLAKTMHPDTNAVHHDEFAQINSAYRMLLTCLNNNLS
ncbi:MAG: hypothetical protein EOM80_01995 [Erysipelotrichia bacterium]|nr:hypothetical protein [Erysipelotrichia bacterium]